MCHRNLVVMSFFSVVVSMEKCTSHQRWTTLTGGHLIFNKKFIVKAIHLSNPSLNGHIFIKQLLLVHLLNDYTGKDFYRIY